jgi:hypothetical protein
MAEQKSKIGIIIFTSLALILGIAFLSAINSITITKTNLVSGTDDVNVSLALIDANNVNESYVYQFAGGTDLGGRGNFENFVLSNSTVTLVASTDYDLSFSSGSMTLENTTNVLNFGQNGVATYNYEGDDYLDNSLVRGLLGLMIGLFALVLVAIVITSVVKSFGEDN